MAILSCARATLLGIFITSVLLFIVVAAAGGGHGTYWLAKTFFPWAKRSKLFAASAFLAENGSIAGVTNRCSTV